MSRNFMIIMLDQKMIQVTPKISTLASKFFPSICAYRDKEDKIINFKYIKPLKFDSTCVTFHAKTTSTPKDIVVKFVHHYGEEAYLLLARETLAPQLFYHGKIGVLQGDPSYEHLQMVVMEYIDGETLDQVKQILLTFLDQIQHALDVLHGQGYVFGDLQAVLYTPPPSPSGLR
jgi:hypothetical protein